MKYLLIILFSCSAFISCKKDKLEDDKEIFIGEWEWIRTQHTVFNCYEPGYSEIFTPENKSTNYTVEFKKGGRISFFQEDEKLYSKRIVFSSFSIDHYIGGLPVYFFGIDMDNSLESLNSLNGKISFDSLWFNSRFPFEADEDGCESYLNFFVKQ